MFGVEVKRIASSITETWLRSTFSHCGTIEHMEYHNQGLGGGENFAFVYFSSREEAERAVEELQGDVVDGMAIEIRRQEDSQEKPRSETPPITVSTHGGTNHVLKVTNIDKSVGEDVLKTEFKTFPGFESLKLISTVNGPSYAWVNYSISQGAQEAIKLDGKMVQGAPLKVTLRRPSSAQISPGAVTMATPVSEETPQTAGKEFSFKIDSESTQEDATRNKSIFASSKAGIPISKLPSQSVAGSATSFSAGLLENIDRKPSHPPNPPLLSGGTRPLIQKKTQTVPQAKRSAHTSHQNTQYKGRATTCNSKRTSRSPNRESQCSSAPYQRPASPHRPSNRLKSDNGKMKSMRETCKKSACDTTAQGKLDSRNPFFAASNSASNQAVTPPQPLPVTHTKEMKLQHKLVYDILTSKGRNELETIVNKFCISLASSDNCGFLLSGTSMDSLDEAEKAITELAAQVQGSITYQDLKLHCKYAPLLASPSVKTELMQAERLDCFQFSIVDQSGAMCEISGLEDVTQHTASQPFKVESLGKFLTSSATTCNWLSEDDNGKLTVLSPQICALLNKSHNPKSTTVFFTHQGQEYRVDFESGTLQDTSTGRKRQLQRQLWHMDSQALSSEQSNLLEHSYQYGSQHLCLDGYKCTADFKRMVLINMDTWNEYSLYPPSVEHVATQTEAPLCPVQEITLRIHGLESDVKNVASQIETKLMAKLVECTVSLPEVASTDYAPAVSSLVFNNARQYCVSVEEHQESNKITIHGEQTYVKRVEVALLDQTLQLRKELHKIDSEYPANWSEQSEECAFIDASKEEQKFVLDLMEKTIPKVNIKRLTRIQHKSQWKFYSLQRDTMRRNHDPNEMHLFHGTRNTDPYEVVKSEKGIDFRHSRSSRLLWGNGSYFAVKASYSHSDYAHEFDHTLFGKYKQLIIAKVLTGLSKDYGTQSMSTLNMPPTEKLPDGKTVVYDTVCGTTNGCKVYVVFDHCRVYPAYIVKYQ